MPRKKEISTTLHNNCKKIFNAFYKKHKGIDFYFDGKQIGQLNEILKRIRRMKQNKLFDVTDNDIFKTFTFVLWNIDDKGFIWDNLSPSIMVGQWNQVIAQCRKNYRGDVVKKESIKKPDTSGRSGEADMKSLMKQFINN